MTDVTHYHAVESTPTATSTDLHHSVGGTQSNANRARFDSAYIKTKPGLIKIVEIILSLIVFICAAVAIREHAVFYGCAVWAAVVGFFSMLFTLVFLILYCFHIPSSAASVPWKTIETAYNAIWTICFLIAGVTMTVVAESAITRVRTSYYTSSIMGDKFQMSSSGSAALPPLPEVFPVAGQGYKQEWFLQKTTGNHDEFRAATAGAVFAFAAMLVYAVDAFLTNTERAREARLLKNRSKNGVV